MKKTLFIDFENALISPVKDLKFTVENLAFKPGVFLFLGRIAREMDYEFFLLNTSKVSEKIMDFVVRTFGNEGIQFSSALLPEKNKSGFDFNNACVITSPALAEGFIKQGFRVIALDENKKSKQKQKGKSATIVSNWEEIYKTFSGESRKVKHQRSTRETSCIVDINLDGSGKSAISTGLHFFDHMLDQIARHGLLDLDITMKGDLHIDEHHTIEDTAITLGEAFLLALGDKKGIERYGFCLPMDDALAQVALDFGGRNHLIWKATFKREKIGDVPTEMFYHFFKSFSDAAKCNLNIQATGENEHHKIEAIFKAFAKAIKMAVKRDLNNMQLPSTKGVL